MKTNIKFFIISRSFLVTARNVFDYSCRENQNTRIVFNNFVLFFRKSCLYEIMWKNIVDRGWPRDRMALAHYMLGTFRLQIHTMSLCNTDCFYTAIMVIRTHFDVPLSFVAEICKTHQCTALAERRISERVNLVVPTVTTC
jgi:hypothetical protein